MAFLQNARFIISVNHFDELPIDEGIEIAFAGRSNAGKSSLLNSLSKQNRLAYVSKQPGRTQLINFFSIGEHMSLVDLPGYGYAKVSKKDRSIFAKFIYDYLEKRCYVFPQLLFLSWWTLDIQMLDWFAPRLKPIHILLTKSDKLSKDKSLRALSDVKNKVQTQWADSFHTKFTVQLFSSLKKQGVEDKMKLFKVG